MIKTLLARMHQGYQTIQLSKVAPSLPERFRGVPLFSSAQCNSNCISCITSCPVQALEKGKSLTLDLGKCIFCNECSVACPSKNITFSKQYKLAARNKKDLISTGIDIPACNKLENKMLSIFGRSLKLRQVSAGGCNACEADINVLSTVGWDLGRFGIQVVSSPRHADGLLVTGPVTENMRIALLKTYDALPAPKLVIAVGACAISGGLFKSSSAQHCGVDTFLPVDLYIPGCPPHPATILDGFLALLDKL